MGLTLLIASDWKLLNKDKVGPKWCKVYKDISKKSVLVTLLYRGHVFKFTIHCKKNKKQDVQMCISRHLHFSYFIWRTKQNGCENIPWLFECWQSCPQGYCNSLNSDSKSILIRFQLCFPLNGTCEGTLLPVITVIWKEC